MSSDMNARTLALMRNHWHVRDDELQGYLDGTLEPKELKSIESHLRRCVGCRGDVETLRKALAAFDAPVSGAVHANDVGARGIGAPIRRLLEFPDLRLPSPVTVSADASSGRAVSGKSVELARVLDTGELAQRPAWAGDVIEIWRWAEPTGSARYEARISVSDAVSEDGETVAWITLIGASGDAVAQACLTQRFPAAPFEGDTLPSRWEDLTGLEIHFEEAPE